MSFQTRKTFMHLQNTNSEVWSSLHSIDSKGPTMIKAQERSKDIVKMVHVTSVVKP